MTDMRNRLVTRRNLTFALLLVTLGLGIGIGTVISDRVLSAEESTKVALLNVLGEGPPLRLDSPMNLGQGFSEIARAVEAAVVNINTTALIRRSTPQRNTPDKDFRDFFGDDFLEKFFGAPGTVPEERNATSLGTGVIVDSEGYILTNYHVVATVTSRRGVNQMADKIEATLHTGESYEARVIGGDPESDLAVLKIDSTKPFPFAKVGDTSKMEVGDWVLAIGNPFGVGQTVTSGIVSAIKRVVPAGRVFFGDYIQTDAAINPGNSGGPLVNTRAEVIGINTFIFSRSGGSQGVGFSIPSSVFINSYNQLVSKGRIERGWLGVSMNYDPYYPMTPVMAEYFGIAGDDFTGIKDGDGVIVTQLINEHGLPDDTGPAYEAGVKPEDVVVKFGGREIETINDLRSAVAYTPPGEKQTLVIVRKGKVVNLTVTLAERQLERRSREGQEGLSFEQHKKPERTKEIGLEFETLRPRAAEQLGLEKEIGVQILDVAVGSLADDAGLKSGQVITHVNGELVRTAQDLLDEINSMSSGQGVVLRVVSVDPRDRDRRQSIAFTSFLKP